MLAFSVSALDPEGALGQGVSHRLLHTVARVAGPHAATLNTQAVTNLAWALACCGQYPSPALDQLRRRAAALRGSMTRADLAQMYQIQLAVQYERDHGQPPVDDKYTATSSPSSLESFS